MLDRVVYRAVACAAAGSFAFSMSALAVPIFGYATGSGGNTSSLVVDFSESGGEAYMFEYSYDGEATGLEMLAALDAAGDLEVFTTVFSFGTAIDGFAFGGQSQDVGFDAVTGRNWSYWIDGGSQDVTDFSVDPPVTQREAVAVGAYVGASSGAGSRFLSDGSVDGWIVNVSSFNSSGAAATNDVPSRVPEPAVALVGVAAVLLRRRSR